jgi:hypothetical protein
MLLERPRTRDEIGHAHAPCVEHGKLCLATRLARSRRVAREQVVVDECPDGARGGTANSGFLGRQRGRIEEHGRGIDDQHLTGPVDAVGEAGE